MRERRRDPVTAEWRTFSTARQSRTFLPPTEHCPLCPTLDPGAPTEVPWSEFDVVTFENRFPALVSEPEPPTPGAGVFEAAPAAGATEVIVYSDRHDATLPALGRDRIRLLIDVWADRYAALGARADIDYVFVFENRGEAVGVTLHHPHGQVYGYPDVPPIARRELTVARRRLRDHGTCVWCESVAQERAEGVRVVAHNDGFLAFVPYAARFPYEVHVGPQRHVPSLLDLGDRDRDHLAEILTRLLRGYDALFGFPLPYVMAMHQSPTVDGDWEPVSHLHLEYMPLHRTADRLKYLAGSELGAGAFLNDVAPEVAAAQLRDAIS
jgi:UDPglucose--hexose-1-phosphate uridylyltransferase